MKSGAKGAEVIVSGKARASRAKAMKFSDGFMIKAGHPSQCFMDTAVRHLKMKQGTLGIKVIIMRPYDPETKLSQLPDVVTVREPKAEKEVGPPTTAKPAQPAPTAATAATAAPVMTAPQTLPQEYATN